MQRGLDASAGFGVNAVSGRRRGSAARAIGALDGGGEIHSP
jgi:hypothetical protein